MAFILPHVRASAFEIVVDYTYDTENFFDSSEKRQAIEAAAARYSRVIKSSLAPVSSVIDVPCGNATCQVPWRIGFSHPGTGEPFDVSTASSAADDLIDTRADEYGFPGLAADEWILFVGGRSLASTAIGGTATGINFTAVFDADDGPLHRGAIPNTPSNSFNDLPTWGGYVSFSTDTNWHFDTATPPIFGQQVIDFYSIALHEIGHVLGMSTTWNQWQEHIVDTRFQGEHAIAALNADNDTNATYLNLASSTDLHWQDGTHKSLIFQPGEPNRTGTVGDGLQDLLLEPVSNFNSDVRRFELTNVDVGALADIGWEIIEPARDPLDSNADSRVDGVDLDLACGSGQSISEFLREFNSPQGDIDLDGRIQFSDFLILSNNFGSRGAYSEGDVTCDGTVSFADFLLLADGFGATTPASNVPEPAGRTALLVALLGLSITRFRPAT